MFNEKLQCGYCIWVGYGEGMESRTIMVPADGMIFKLRQELQDDVALADIV